MHPILPFDFSQGSLSNPSKFAKTISKLFFIKIATPLKSKRRTSDDASDTCEGIVRFGCTPFFLVPF